MTPFSRRVLLGGLAAAGGSTLIPSKALAATAPPKRFIVCHVPEGMWSGAMRPQVGGTSFGPLLQPLDPFKQYVTVLNNLDLKSRDHGPGGDGHHRGVPHMLTCTEMVDVSNAGGMSVDQKIAAAIKGTSPRKSIQLAVRIVYGDTNARVIWGGPSNPMSPIQSPWTAYDQILKGVTAPPAPPAAVDLKRSALDHSLQDTAALRLKLSGADRDRLDSYQDSLRDIEKRLATIPPPFVGTCTPPVMPATYDAAAEANYPKVGKLQMDIMVAALQCDVTRVASLQWGNSNDQCAYSWLGVNTLGHDMAHNNSNCDPTGSKKAVVTRWYAEQFAYLMGRLQSIKESDGTTMLDNTIVLWVSEFSDCNGHAANTLMWVMMGNVSSHFRTGRVIDCGGASVNDLHTSLCQAYGITDAKYGNPAYCNGPLPGLKA